MEMTIDTAMRNLSMYDIDKCGNAELHTWYHGIDDDMRESFAVAINTMCKYQKIEQIINYRYRSCVSETLDEIIKVIEDGNN